MSGVGCVRLLCSTLILTTRGWAWLGSWLAGWLDAHSLRAASEPALCDSSWGTGGQVLPVAPLALRANLQHLPWFREPLGVSANNLWAFIVLVELYICYREMAAAVAQLRQSI